MVDTKDMVKHIERNDLLFVTRTIKVNEVERLDEVQVLRGG